MNGISIQQENDVIYTTVAFEMYTSPLTVLLGLDM